MCENNETKQSPFYESLLRVETASYPSLHESASVVLPALTGLTVCQVVVINGSLTPA